jgi:hypothetical protein
LYSGNTNRGEFINNSRRGSLGIEGHPDRVPNSGPTCASTTSTIEIFTSCSTSNLNDISGTTVGDGEKTLDFGDFHGAVECSQGGGTQSSSMTGTTQDEHRDGDGDGVPDSSDRCLNNSNPRCFKEEAK